MAFNQNIPQATDRIRDSQLALLNNFIELNTAFDINHVSFNDANHGKHKWVSMPEQGAAPATAANEGAVYSREGAISTVTELAWRRENNGDEIEFTGARRVADGGWTMLPSGILLKWGATNTAPTAGLATYAFPVLASIPVFTNIYNIIVCPSSTDLTDIDLAVRIIDFTTTTFRIYGSARTTLGDKIARFRYLAIGD